MITRRGKAHYESFHTGGSISSESKACVIKKQLEINELK
jgi:hypothetical protein